jgi:hypothetical protein
MASKFSVAPTVQVISIGWLNAHLSSSYKKIRLIIDIRYSY